MSTKVRVAIILVIFAAAVGGLFYTASDFESIDQDQYRLQMSVDRNLRQLRTASRVRKIMLMDAFHDLGSAAESALPQLRSELQEARQKNDEELTNAILRAIESIEAGNPPPQRREGDYDDASYEDAGYGTLEPAERDNGTTDDGGEAGTTSPQPGEPEDTAPDEGSESDDESPSPT